ncbi:glycosyltransferase [Mycolicibacterium mengxianglii]|uniref:glycosyltransferase n=1 Tax=Mycolicibacterium mengxianglii TaxID=2736649 RepID=UPI0018EEDC50|nr:glycosyltransferase [Mycolicibacterium mengxianglii]
MRLAIVLTETDSTTVTGTDGVAELVVPPARLSSELAAVGHDVSVYLPSPGRAPGSEVMSAQGYRVVRVPSGGTRRKQSDDLGVFSRNLQQVWGEERPDVVHAQSWLSGMAAQLAARSHGLPVVQSFDDIAVTDRRTGAGDAGQGRKLVSLLARRASWVAANNNDELFELLRMGCVRSRISVVPYGVDSEVFTPPGEAAQRSGLQHRIVAVWASTGRLGVDTAVRALAALPDTELVLALDATAAGAREVSAELLQAAGVVGVADRVTIADVRAATDLAALLRSADVCVCPAVTEPTGAAALMAMSCGVPVVATAVGALGDIVVDEVTGRLVPPGNVVRFAEATRRLLHEPFAGRGMGAAGRDRARSRYSWDRVAGDAARAYNGALGAVGVVSA